MNRTAAELLQAYAEGIEPEGGVLYAKALRQVPLDYSAASLKRIDALLDQIRARVGIAEEGFLENIPKRHFALTLAFYLGECVARTLDKPIEWYDYHSAADRLQRDIHLPYGFSTYAVGMIDGNVCLPLDYVHNRLFKQNGTRCAYHVASMVSRIAQRAREDAGMAPTQAIARCQAAGDHVVTGATTH